jgi:hypothetical protein
MRYYPDESSYLVGSITHTGIVLAKVERNHAKLRAEI